MFESKRLLCEPRKPTIRSSSPISIKVENCEPKCDLIGPAKLKPAYTTRPVQTLVHLVAPYTLKSWDLCGGDEQSRFYLSTINEGLNRLLNSKVRFNLIFSSVVKAVVET